LALPIRSSGGKRFGLSPALSGSDSGDRKRAR